MAQAIHNKKKKLWFTPPDKEQIVTEILVKGKIKRKLLMQ